MRIIAAIVLSAIAVFIGRLLIPSHGLSLPGTYEGFAHIWVGVMACLWLGGWWASRAFQVKASAMSLIRADASFAKLDFDAYAKSIVDRFCEVRNSCETLSDACWCVSKASGIALAVLSAFELLAALAYLIFGFSFR